MPRDDRARDERDLFLVRARTAGELPTALGARLGISAEAVRTITTRIRNDDIAKSGEPPDVVAAGYWRR